MIQLPITYKIFHKELILIAGCTQFMIVYDPLGGCYEGQIHLGFVVFLIL